MSNTCPLLCKWNDKISNCNYNNIVIQNCEKRDWSE